MEPAAQIAHPAALAVPGLVTAPEKPGAQTVQAVTDVLPGPVVAMPRGQAVQLAAPAEYAPAGHGVQEGATPPAHAQLKSAAALTREATPKLPGVVQVKT